MNDLIVDTSVWINFFNGTETLQVDNLISAIESDNNIILIPTILQEILQGFSKDNDYEIAKQLILEFTFIQVGAKEAAIGSADLYRKLRKKGITIRKSNNCMIAYYAIYLNVPILHKDRDFDIISEYTRLKVVKF